MRLRPALFALLVLSTGCLGSPRVGARSADGTGAGVSPTFSSIAQTILVPSCATSACHGGSSPNNTPALDADLAYAQLVGVPSTQSSLNLVEPGHPEQSYLVVKLRGTMSAYGGWGEQMPVGSPLSEEDLSAIEAWITNGASHD
jgi:hypothetical protein